MKFYSNLENFKNNLALIDSENTKFTYLELIEKAKILSKKFEKRSLILILMDNDLESVVSLIAADISNSVLMLIDKSINLIALENLIKTYEPKLIFLNKLNKKNLKGYSLVSEFYNYELVKKDNFSNNLIENDELFLLQTTSGSTGSPKNVKLSFKNLISNTQSIINALNITEKETAITTLPPSYVYGLSIINTHLKSGAKIVLNKNSVIEREFWDRIKNNKVTNFGGVPYTYELLIRIGLNKDNFKTINFTTQAGGYLDKNSKKRILEFYDRHKKTFFVMYGAAEATARMTCINSKFLKTKIESIGKPIINGKLSIQNENGKEILETGKKGELVYEGENIFIGYANSYADLNINKKVLRLKTGDIGFKDNEGYFYISGKKSRYVKVYGHRVNLDDIEKIINFYGVRSVCVQNKKDNCNCKTPN